METKVLCIHLKNAMGKKIQKLCTRLGIETVFVEENDFLKPLGELAGIKDSVENEKAETEKIETEKIETEKAETKKADTEKLEMEKEDIHEVAAFSEPMLILVNFTDALLDRYLKEYKVMHIDRIDLKAVLTEHNQKWNVMKLYEELCREREYFR